MSVATLGSLEEDGTPHVSFVTLVSQKNGTAVLLLSDLARHTANIGRDKRASLLVLAGNNNNAEKSVGSGNDPLAEARITAHGTIEHYSTNQYEIGKALFVKHHPASIQYIDFQDFKLYCFLPSKIFMVGGFGRIETLSADILCRT
jgi:putative heme iron utilization protein